MPQALQCPHCQGAVTVADEDAGQRVTCPHCERVFLAPGVAASAGVSASHGDDEDDWLTLDEAPVKSPLPQTKSPATPAAATQTDVSKPTRTDELGGQPQKPSGSQPGLSEKEKAMLNELAGFDTNDSDDDFVLTTEQLPSKGSKPSGSAGQRAGNERIDAPEPSAFDEYDLPDFVDSGPAAAKPTQRGGDAGARPATGPVAGSATGPATPQDAPTAASTNHMTDYRVKCPTCGSVLYAKAKQAGKNVKCSDCHSIIKVPPPPKVKPKPVAMTEDVAPLPMQPSRSGERRPDPFEKSAAELLRKAEQSDDEEPAISYDDPDMAEWFKSVFGIFTDSGVVVHWLAFSLLASFPTYLALISGHKMLIFILFPFALLIGSLVTTCGFAILQAVANQEDHVSDWPVFEPFAWFGQLFLAAAAAGVVVVPVWAVFVPILGPSLLLVVLTMMSVYALFPFVLLSMLDHDSPFVPFSAEVARSVTKCQEAWGGLYLTAGVLFFGLFLVIAMAWSVAIPSGVFVVITLGIAVMFVYFSMIGRLAFAIGQAINAAPRPSEPRETSELPTQESHGR